jgi:hypothetical protein
MFWLLTLAVALIYRPKARQTRRNAPPGSVIFPHFCGLAPAARARGRGTSQKCQKSV